MRGRRAERERQSCASAPAAAGDAEVAALEVGDGGQETGGVREGRETRDEGSPSARGHVERGGGEAGGIGGVAGARVLRRRCCHRGRGFGRRQWWTGGQWDSDLNFFPLVFELDVLVLVSSC